MPVRKATLHRSIAEIGAEDWDRCAGHDNPFVSHAFLSALEDSGSTGMDTGWIPQHVSLSNDQDQIEAVIPLYAKTHSYGEYVFDQGWADALQRAGGNYYPKLQAAVPFSPVPGPRLLIRPDSALGVIELGHILVQASQQLDLSSVHVTFCTETEWQALGNAGWLQRLGMQFHWHNQNYKSFDDFLNALSSRRRKVLKRERRDANGCGLVFKTLTGDAIKPLHWDHFYRFYQATVDRKWGSAYLTRDFFTLLSQRLADKVVLMIAEHEGTPVAGALNLVGKDTLYGRNWGCIGDWPFLHFELCYYRAIDYAIEHELKQVEAGAQGTHKIQRGYMPQPTYSAHWLNHPGLARAVGQFVLDERNSIEEQMHDLATLSPFKTGETEN